MNTTKSLIVLVGVAVIGYLGYSFYTSYNEIGNDDLAYETTMSDPYDEIDSFDQEDLILESDLNYLEGMEFDGTEENTIESEQAFESQISTEEQQEASFENDINELESMDF